MSFFFVCSVDVKFDGTSLRVIIQGSLSNQLYSVPMHLFSASGTVTKWGALISVAPELSEDTEL